MTELGNQELLEEEYERKDGRVEYWKGMYETNAAACERADAREEQDRARFNSEAMIYFRELVDVEEEVWASRNGEELREAARKRARLDREMSEIRRENERLQERVNVPEC